MSYMGRQSFGGLSRNGSFKNLRAMTDEEIMRVAPSVFATECHESRSDRYSYIPTSAILDGLRDNGFEVVSAAQGRSRIPGKEDYTKHLLRLRRVGELVVEPRLGGLLPEICISNSHDGTASYKVMAGLMRVACLNGLIVADRELASISVPHKGDVTSRVIEGSFTVIDESMAAIETAGTWSGITLGREEQLVLAEAVHGLRFGDADGVVTTPILPRQLLETHRREDMGDDLWRVNNRIQEATLRGGLTARATTGARRSVTSRPVESIDKSTSLNRAIWQLSAEMARLKTA